MFLACQLYKLLIDPLLKSVREKVASLIPDESSVVEIGSGTGAQSLLLAKTGRRVVGVDINEVMVDCASKSASKLNLNNIKYHTADGSSLTFIKDKEFDYTTITLALHELNDDLRKQILIEMKRISKHLVIVEYSVPLPKNIAGWGCKHIEMLAGKDHYAGFKDYTQRGGILSIIEELDFKIERQYTAINSSITILTVTN